MRRPERDRRLPGIARLAQHGEEPLPQLRLHRTRGSGRGRPAAAAASQYRRRNSASLRIRFQNSCLCPSARAAAPAFPVSRTSARNASPSASVHPLRRPIRLRSLMPFQEEHYKNKDVPMQILFFAKPP